MNKIDQAFQIQWGKIVKLQEENAALKKQVEELQEDVKHQAPEATQWFIKKQSEQIESITKERDELKEALEWLSITLNKIVKYSDSHLHIFPTYQVRDFRNRILSDEKTPLEAIQKAMGEEK